MPKVGHQYKHVSIVDAVYLVVDVDTRNNKVYVEDGIRHGRIYTVALSDFDRNYKEIK